MTPAAIPVTFFTDYAAQLKREEALHPTELARRISDMVAAEKARLPWLKLARFGSMRSDKNSLRHDANVLAISGIEGDYDGEKISFDEAIDIADKAGLAAILYTSPSHTADKPRWRVLCPTSGELPPAERYRLMARLNGLYRDIFAVESFTLSQSYYFGHLADSRDHRVELVDGTCIDLLDGLDKTAMGKPNGGTARAGDTANGSTASFGVRFGLFDETAVAAEIVSGARYHTACTGLLGHWASRGVAYLDALHRLKAIFEKVPEDQRDERWRARYADIRRCVRDIYGKEAKKADETEQTPRPATPAVFTIKGECAGMERVDWVWPCWLARGKFHVLGGQKGTGKSSIAFDLLAAISSGGKFPDGTPAARGRVLIWSAEDDVKDTILPRFVVAGGDPCRVEFIAGIDNGGTKRSFDPAIDIPNLLAYCREIPDLKALLIDPIVLAVAADSHKNAESRRGLQPLVDLTIERNIILFGITHFTKGTQGADPIERITGSLAFGAIPRVVLAAVKGDSEEASRKLVRIGSNIGPMGGAFEYLLRQDRVPDHDFTAQRVVWGKYIEGSPLELVEGNQAKSKKLAALQLLDTLLANGPVAVTDIKEAATANGISWPTIERAKSECKNIVAEQHNRAWHWRKTHQGLYHS